MFSSKPGQPNSIDPFLVALLVAVVIVFGMLMLADKVVFVHGPRSLSDRVIALPTLVAYGLMSDRVMANVAAFFVWGTVVGCTVIGLYIGIMNYFLPRQMMREMVEKELEEEELKNRFKREIRQNRRK